MVVIFVELWNEILYFFMTNGSSDIQLALLFSKTGFFNKLRKVLMTRSAIEWTLSVNLESSCIFLLFKKF